MVFVIQNTQYRDGAAIQIKLDELVRSVEGAHNALLDLEELNEAEIESFRRKYLELARKARDDIRHEKTETSAPEIQFPA
jgi:low affinity Fe/Cu permease